MLGLTESDLTGDVTRERAELHRREELYRGGRPPPGFEGRTVIVVDDGLATGVTARAALRNLRAKHPGRLILAVPVGSPQAVEALRQDADDIVCLYQPSTFRAVGEWYEDFAQVSDDEVIATLARFGGSSAQGHGGQSAR
jgi:predicted phosphoribosyltransferase